MKFSVTYITSNRKLGKAYRRIYAEIQELCRIMEKELPEYSEFERIDLWIVDKPPSYFEITKRNLELFEIHSGIDQSLSFLLADDSKFLDEIKKRLDRVLLELKR